MWSIRVENNDFMRLLHLKCPFETLMTAVNMKRYVGYVLDWKVLVLLCLGPRSIFTCDLYLYMNCLEHYGTWWNYGFHWVSILSISFSVSTRSRHLQLSAKSTFCDHLSSVAGFICVDTFGLKTSRWLWFLNSTQCVTGWRWLTYCKSPQSLQIPCPTTDIILAKNQHALEPSPTIKRYQALTRSQSHTNNEVRKPVYTEYLLEKWIGYDMSICHPICRICRLHGYSML